jgi:peptidoglycan hydrolase-like protein with peptidoglycan-binding domain
MTKSKKVALGFALAAVFAMTGATAQAATSAELQAQINALMAQLAALQTPAVSVVLTSDLTMGSTGAQVVTLQSFLESKGYLVMPVGVAKGYFGGLTRAALVKFQLANGISPAVGYFGPKTRAAVIAMLAVTPGQGPIVVVPGTGTEGELNNDDQLGSIGSETLDEGEDAAEVLGIEFDAEDSNMTIDRVDVDFEATTVSGSDHLDRYVDSVSLWLDGKKIAEGDVDEADEDSDVYSFRFSGLNAVVKDGDTAELVVAVDVVSNVDSDDLSEWTVTIDEDAIRATDTKGISDTYFGTPYDETFTVGEADAGELTVGEASSNPDARDVEADEDVETDDIVLLAFDLEADEQDVMVESIPVTIRTVGATNAAVFKNVQLYQGSTLLDTKSVTSTSASSSVVFDDLDITIDADSDETFTIKATVNDLDGTNFAEGDMASSTVYGALIDAEDEAGDNVTPSGDADGEVVTFRSIGVDVDLTSVTESNDSDSTPDLGTFTFKFKVTAFGEDVYLSSTSTSGEANAIVYALTGGTIASSTLTSTADESGNAFVVDEGDTEDFTFTVIVDGNSSFTDVEITGIKWGESAAGSTQNTTTVDEWESDPLFLSAN